MIDSMTEEREFGLRYLYSFEARIGDLVALLAPLVVLLVKVLRDGGSAECKSC